MTRCRLHPCILTAILILFIFTIGCIEKIERPTRVDYHRYFPLNKGDWRQFSGPLGKTEITEQLKNIYTYTYYDSAGNITGWKDFVDTESGVYLKNIVSKTDHMPSVFYEPALRFSPWSNIIGDTLFQTAIEIAQDSLNTHLMVMVEYEVLALDTVITPAGRFTDCIKIQMDYSAPQETRNKIYDGITIWWFARDMGLVKYKAFGVVGELLEAEIDGVLYPQ